ncbi:hypothetical protein Taro_008554 [Colocasia esculenta]|uniref:Uncharacterized protein n=1 Tax=Colocasia esculenta TaxID=4460 RepID=A0A843U2L5_COLES|nr:hypothetical protein [Colocasia esculenta]
MKYPAEKYEKKKGKERKFRKYKKKALAATWDNEEATSSDSSSLESDEEEKTNLALMAGLDQLKKKDPTERFEKKKGEERKFKKYKKKAMAVAWDNEEPTSLDSSSSESEEEEKTNLALMARLDQVLQSYAPLFPFLALPSKPSISPFSSSPPSCHSCLPPFAPSLLPSLLSKPVISELPRSSKETHRRPSSVVERLATTPPSSIQSPLPSPSLDDGEPASNDGDGNDHDTHLADD